MSTSPPPNFYDVLKQKVVNLTKPEPLRVRQLTPMQNRFFKRASRFNESRCDVTDEVKSAVESTQFPEEHKAIHRCRFCMTSNTIRAHRYKTKKKSIGSRGSFDKHLSLLYPEKLKFLPPILCGDAELVQGESLGVTSIVTVESNGNFISTPKRSMKMPKNTRKVPLEKRSS